MRMPVRECELGDREGFTTSSPLISHCRILVLRSAEASTSPIILRIPHDHTVSRAPSEHLLPFSLDFTLQECLSCGAPNEHSYKRAPSYTDVASMKLKQDVESSWKCPFVSASEGKAKHNKHSAM